MIHVLSDCLLEDYLRCHSKSYLRVQGRLGQATAYSNLCAKLDASHRANAFHWLTAQLSAAGVRSLDGSRLEHLDTGDVLILDTVGCSEGLETHFHGLQRVPGESNLGAYYYRPIRAHRNLQPNSIVRLLLRSMRLYLVTCRDFRQNTAYSFVVRRLSASAYIYHIVANPSQRFLRVFVSRSPASKNRRLH